jgi:hypothetical protein
MSFAFFVRPSATKTMRVGPWAFKPTGDHAQSGPTLLKASIAVRANRLKRYWKAPDMDDYWSWLPEMSFVVLGPRSLPTSISARPWLPAFSVLRSG